MENTAAFEKIDALNKEAWAIRVNDINQANILSKQAVELSIAGNYDKGKAEGLRTLAFSCIRVSKHTEALEYLEESLSLFEKLNDIRGQSDVYEYFGIIKRNFGDYKVRWKICMPLFKACCNIHEGSEKRKLTESPSNRGNKQARQKWACRTWI